ncbi:MAG: phytanoyl-CoA dioxygenase family protein [Gammaproteobacteria bacterium]
MGLQAFDASAGGDYGAEQAAMSAFLREGEARARALSNRGPIRFDADGMLAADILDAYWRTGFYVFTGVLGADELGDLERDIAEVVQRAPVSAGAEVDGHGRPALGRDCRAPTFFHARPLSDPFGGTDLANGRHPSRMFEPTPAAGAPAETMYLFLGSLQFSDACLRLYGHPQLLAVAAAVNGADFTPFNEAVWIKHPGLGASVAWHQDGVTHWDSPDLDAGTHGFNFMAQLYGCTASNGVWVVPGSHARGKVDIAALVAAAGSERLPDAVPILCDPGDVAMCNRQVVHGSFANVSRDTRVTINFGFHRRASVLDVTAGGVHNEPAIYDAARIRHRARLIAYAIDARRQRFPDETPYEYAPLAAACDEWRWSEAARADLHDYNLHDLSI